MKPAPKVRIRANDDMNDDGDYVLYWMIAYRRPRYNFALQQAVHHAKTLKKPLLVFEPLRAKYPWSSPRFHQFVIEGMRNNQTYFDKTDVTYFPYVEPKHPEGRGLLAELASNACVVVSDDFPCFFLPRMIQAAKDAVPCRFELVDGNGIMPMRATDRIFTRAHDYRRFVQKNIRDHWDDVPHSDPAKAKLPTLKKKLPKKWPAADLDALLDGGISSMELLHDVPTVDTTGGFKTGEKVLRTFLKEKLENYDQRNHPDLEAESGLSPYLHFGHISAYHVFESLMKHDGWSRDDVAVKANGSREGFWGASVNVEAFLDQLITWREVGFNMCAHTDDFDQYETLPNWAQVTLEEHAYDEREYVYSIEEFENAATHDEIWNAAQHQLRKEGTIHNYLRMLWGKKILHWTEKPQDALEIMIELNNKYALDGRDPNSYSGIFWCLGRYDRAWGPEREIFGKVRYMTSKSTRSKLKLKKYLETWSVDDEQGNLFSD